MFAVWEPITDDQIEQNIRHLEGGNDPTDDLKEFFAIVLGWNRNRDKAGYWNNYDIPSHWVESNYYEWWAPGKPYRDPNTHEVKGRLLPHFLTDFDDARSIMPPGSLWCVGDMEDGPFARVLKPNADGSFIGPEFFSVGKTVEVALFLASMKAWLALRDKAIHKTRWKWRPNAPSGRMAQAL